MNIYRLLDIRPDSNKLWFLLVPPVYSLWLLAIGKKLLRKMNKSDIFFSIVTIAFFLVSLTHLIVAPFVSLKFLNAHKVELAIFVPLYFILAFISLTTVTFVTVRFDRLQLQDKYYSALDSIDYIRRFFALFFWPLFIWTFQSTVNTYNHK